MYSLDELCIVLIFIFKFSHSSSSVLISFSKGTKSSFEPLSMLA
uniref:Uncharacterized protein n=1 Tax=Arundo donax TaxID=35708 RepID=A0A0A9HHC9_ARUDO